MMTNSNTFIGTYTNQVKDYCDELFLENLGRISGNDIPVVIVDNTQGPEYMKRLNRLASERIPLLKLVHMDVEEEPKRTQFLRNVEQSANVIRNLFINSDKEYLFLIESDVIPPLDVIEQFAKGMQDIPEEANWAVFGGLYYKGVHDYAAFGVHRCQHALAGCTVYKRELIEQFPFRWSELNIHAFPDAWICHDANENGYSCWNNHDIICSHVALPSGARQSKAL